MNYVRVIPRDLFNEANLLKCYGRLSILLGNSNDHAAELSESNGEPFDIVQDESSGDLTIANLPFSVDGRLYRLSRPLNSRGEWPLYLTDDAEEEIPVFTDVGNFTDEFKSLIKDKSPWPR